LPSSSTALAASGSSEGQVHNDTHVLPIGNYVIAVGNYVIVSPSELGNYKIADNHAGGVIHEYRLVA
jgi:hypothetical protein